MIRVALLASLAIFAASVGFVAMLTLPVNGRLHGERLELLEAREMADLRVAASILEVAQANVAGDVVVATSVPALIAVASNPNAANRVLAERYLQRFLSASGRYVRLRIVNAAGTDILTLLADGVTSVDVVRSLPSAADLADGGDLQAPRTVFISELSAGRVNGVSTPLLRFHAAILDPEDGTVLGGLFVEYDATSHLERAFAAFDQAFVPSEAFLVLGGGFALRPPTDGNWHRALRHAREAPIDVVLHGVPRQLPTTESTVYRVDRGRVHAWPIDANDQVSGFRIAMDPTHAGADAMLSWTIVTLVAPSTLRALTPLNDPALMTLAIGVVITLALLSLLLGYGVARLLRERRTFERDALVDALTGLANRRAFDADLMRAVERARRYDESLCVAVADLDHFKNVNDAYGHAVGDAALRAFATLAAGALRASDELYRVGGEEFAMLLPRTNLEAGGEVAERVRSAVEGHVLHVDDGTELRVTCSLGVAELASRPSPKDLVNAADEALYHAKVEGRNRVCLAPHAATGPEGTGPNTTTESNECPLRVTR